MSGARNLQRVKSKPVAVCSCAGFTYIGLLILVAIMGVLLATIGTVWHTAMQREKGRELRFVGDEFRRAIGAYYENSPGLQKAFPKTLADLLHDKRYPVVKRYLRKIYYDPFTNSRNWGLVRDAAGNITGVYSLSDETPVKTANFEKGDEQLAGKKHYSGWKFVYVPGSSTGRSSGGAGRVFVPSSQSGDGASHTGQSAQSSGQTTPSLPPAYVPKKPAPPAPDSGQSARQKYVCDLMHYTDVVICGNMLQKFGSDIGNACLTSATARYSACLSGNPIGTLFVWYQN